MEGQELSDAKDGEGDRDEFGPDSDWAYWHDNPEDDAAWAHVLDEAHRPSSVDRDPYQTLAEALSIELFGKRWTNRVRFFFERDSNHGNKG